MNAEDDQTRKAQGAERTSVGTQLSGIYELDERIASGGMGEVFRGHNIQTGDHVAIKIVLPEFARDQTILSLFRKEASILNHLSHDAVVRYHVFTVDPGIGRPYLAMEFVNGQSLFDVLLRGPMSPADVRKLCHRLASGLSAVHEAGAVHRDLSPDNVILPGGRVDRAKIIDFGIARLATVGGETLIGGRFAGKYNYVSPEQLGLYGGEVSEQSDIYSLGLVLAAALRGRPIDMGGSQLEVVEKRRSVPDLSDIDGDLRPIIEMMLQPDPADRLGSMAEIADMTRTVVPQDLDQTLVSKSATIRGRPAGLPQAAQLALAHPVADGPPAETGRGQVGAASPAKPEVRRVVARKPLAQGSNPRSIAAATTNKASHAPQAKRSTRTRMVTIMSLLVLVVAAGAGAYLGGFIPPLAQPAGPGEGETAPLKPDLSKVSKSEETPATDQPAKATPHPSTPIGPEGSSTKAPSTNQPAVKTDQNTAVLQEPPKAPVPQSVATKTPPGSADQSNATSDKDRRPAPAQNNQAPNWQTQGPASGPTTIQPGSTAVATKTPPVSADQSVATSDKGRQPAPAQNNQAPNRQTQGPASVPTTIQPGSTAVATKTPPVSADQSIATSDKDRQPAPAQNNQAPNWQTQGPASVPTTIQPGSTAAATKTPPISADQSIATSDKGRQPAPAQNNKAPNWQTQGPASVPTTIQPGSTAVATKTPPVSADQSIATSDKGRQPAPAQNNQAPNWQTQGAPLVPTTIQPGSTAVATKTPPVSADQSIATSDKDRQPAPAQNNKAPNWQTQGAPLVPTTNQPDSAAGPGGGKPAADKVKEDNVALNVPATQTPAVHAVDEAAERIEWLRAYNGGDCFYAAVTSFTDKVAKIEGFGTAEAPFDAMRQAFQAKFHIQPDISPQIIAPDQCGVVSFLRSLGGTAAKAPKLVLDRTSVLSGAPISGSLETNGGLLSHLLLIDHRGTAFNLDGRITVQFGKANFSIPIGLGAADKAAGKAQPQIMLVITGPDAIQSANFTTPMPASAALAKILAEIRDKGSTFSATAKYFRLGG